MGVKGYSSGLCEACRDECRQRGECGSHLVYLLALAVACTPTVSAEIVAQDHTRTLERLRLLQKPIQPTTHKAKFTQLPKSTSFIYPWIMRKLCPFDEREDDRIFESDECGTDSG